jgi:hypothetical protein
MPRYVFSVTPAYIPSFISGYEILNLSIKLIFLHLKTGYEFLYPGAKLVVRNRPQGPMLYMINFVSKKLHF